MEEIDILSFNIKFTFYVEVYCLQETLRFHVSKIDYYQIKLEPKIVLHLKFQKSNIIYCEREGGQCLLFQTKLYL